MKIGQGGTVEGRGRKINNFRRRQDHQCQSPKPSWSRMPRWMGLVTGWRGSGRRSGRNLWLSDVSSVIEVRINVDKSRDKDESKSKDDTQPDLNLFFYFIDINRSTKNQLND